MLKEPTLTVTLQGVSKLLLSITYGIDVLYLFVAMARHVVHQLVSLGSIQW
jgi:hypothetical protein